MCERAAGLIVERQDRTAVRLRKPLPCEVERFASSLAADWIRNVKARPVFRTDGMRIDDLFRRSCGAL
jgi:hypothetical protein